ncbi:ATP-binding protein [Falsiroseomonas sp. CW058]|uniref:sensor histidine kinase n=1 Tax=Falsiroseomonas sp. CW058 TaxID=3388664 RepID=UPI003D32326F
MLGLQCAAGAGALWLVARRFRQAAARAGAAGRDAQAALAAEEARRRAELLATAAHEIRTPLAGVIGLLDLVLAAPLPRGARADAAAARQAADDLALLLRDLIEVPAGAAAAPEAVTFRVDEVMEQVVGLLGARARAGGNRLATAVAAGTPPAWHGDPARLRQILTNLVSNALRFTEGGEVRIEARENAAGALELRVSDTGRGIAPERMAHLFDRFGSSEGGTGLGLSICRDLAARMGGGIEVRSAPGRGTACTVTLPLPQAPAGEAPPTPPRPPARPTDAAPPVAAPPVLVVDDVAVNRRLLSALLDRAGFAHEEAGDAEAALALVAERPYAAVLMDLEMPGLDGLEATRRLRALPGAAAGLPVIAVTAHGGAGLRAAALAAGMDGHLVKPVGGAELLAALEGARAARAAPALSPGPSQAS